MDRPSYPRKYARPPEEHACCCERRVGIAIRRGAPHEAVAAIWALFSDLEATERRVDPTGRLDQLNLPTQIQNAVESVGILNVLALAGAGAEELLAIPQFGPRSVELVEQALERVGLRLRKKRF